MLEFIIFFWWGQSVYNQQKGIRLFYSDFLIIKGLELENLKSSIFKWLILILHYKRSQMRNKGLNTKKVKKKVRLIRNEN